MKRTVLSFVFLLVAATPSFAQGVALGVKGGINIASASTTQPVVESGKESAWLFHAGAVTDIALGSRFSIQPQLLIGRKGVTFEAGDHTHAITLTSLDLPILAVYKPAGGFSLGVGPNFGVNLSGTNVTSGAITDTHTYEFNGAIGDFKRFDMGVTVMGGYEHPNGLFATVSYLKGITDDLINFPGVDWSHDVLSVSVGYMFKKRP
ncbi:MAG: PorT family protein [Acidobacteria bacterium]|nr:PorT family protein [Acidobacteriota bacterium]